nr:ribonuclease H-like domain-containing protein [Tanacetum cinerariifolium]
MSPYNQLLPFDQTLEPQSQKSGYYHYVTSGHYSYHHKASHDDIIITGNNVYEIKKFKVYLKSKFMIKDLGKLKYFLRIDVIDTSKGIYLNQRKHALDTEYGILACKSAKTPLMFKLIISNEATENDPILDNITDYQKLMDNYDHEVYERSLCYDEEEKSYVEAVIFINTRLVRLIDVTVVQWLDLKYGNHETMDKKIKDVTIQQWTGTALWMYWVRGDDEEVLSDKELSNPKEIYVNEEDETIKIFRIETDIFNFETPLCKAFNEFNYLFKVDTDLLTHDILGFKTYKENKNAWIHE